MARPAMAAAVLACALGGALGCAWAAMPVSPEVAAEPALSQAGAGQADAREGAQRERTLDDALIREFGGHKAVTRPSQDAVMGFSAPTVVKEILTRGGVEVSKGQLMIRGDDAEEAALLKLQKERIAEPLAVERAKAAMDLAKVEYERLKEIQGRGGSGTQEVERARLSYEVSRIDHLTAVSNQTQETIQLERIQARVERFRLSAPFDGVVDQVQVDVGQAVSENEKVVRVVSVDPLWIDVPSPTEDIVTLRLHTGDKAWVLCDVAGRARLEEAKVIEVAPTADPASRTRRVRVELPNPKEHAGGGGGSTGGMERLIAGEPVWVRFTQPVGFALSPVRTGDATAQSQRTGEQHTPGAER